MNLVAARVFGLEHGGIGLFHEVFGFGVMVAEQADADTGAAIIFLPVEIERLLDGGMNFFGNVFGHLRSDFSFGAERFQNHDEFVAAEAGDSIVLIDAGFNALGHFYQKLVADVIAAGIVEVFEIIDIDKQNRAEMSGASRQQ